MDREAILAWGRSKMKDTPEKGKERGYRHFHGLRVAAIGLQMAEELDLPLEADKETLYIGAYLHDVGKAGFTGPGHGPRGADMIRAEIAHLFAPLELDLVLEMVSNHYMRPNSSHFAGKEKPKFRNEVLLVQDADTIDHFGNNGVWLALQWAAMEETSQQHSIDYYYKQDAKWQQEALASLNFALSRRELEYRLKLQHEFFRNWQKEESGQLYVAVSSLV
jgi:HD superfamily phosphodiesterase